MANFDIMCFLEFYADRANVLDPVSGKRLPTRRFQNFYQQAEELVIDTDIDGDFFYLAFDVDGFQSSEAGSTGNLSVNLPAIGDIVDLTDSAMDSDTLVIASLVVQNAGLDSLDINTAQIVDRYIGSIESAGLSDVTVTWSINPAIDKIKAQIPSRKVSSDLIGRFVGQ